MSNPERKHTHTCTDQEKCLLSAGVTSISPSLSTTGLTKSSSGGEEVTDCLSTERERAGEREGGS